MWKVERNMDVLFLSGNMRDGGEYSNSNDVGRRIRQGNILDPHMQRSAMKRPDLTVENDVNRYLSTTIFCHSLTILFTG
jgi:hypothetical protein